MEINEKSSDELNLPTTNQKDKAKEARAGRRRRRVHIANVFLLILFCVLAFFARAIPFFNWDLATQG